MMRETRTMLRFCLAGSMLALLTQPAVALAAEEDQAAAPQAGAATPQDGGKPASTATPDRPQDGEILVVARRREENIQKVPLAVTAISGPDLSARSVVSLTDLTRTVPSLQIVPSPTGGNIPRFTIRGQSQFEGLFALDPSVAVYFADVVQARAHGLNAAMFDLASVQVLKGPQGTLFGRNSTGGAVLIVPQAPTDTLGGYVSVELGNYALRSFEGAVNVPVNDWLSIRLAGRSYAHKGYSPNMINGVRFDDADNYSLRLGVKAKLSSRLTNTLFVNTFRADENGTGFKATGARSVLNNFALGPAALAEFQASQSEPFHSVRTNVQGDLTRQHSEGVENTTVLDVSDQLSLKNIFGFRHVYSNSYYDFDGTGQAMYGGSLYLNERQYSNEFQIVGTRLADMVDVIAGAYYFRESGREIQRSQSDYRPAFLQSTVGQVDVVNKSQSLFAQATLHVPGLDGLSLTGGLRYTWDDRSLDRVATNNGACSLLSADVGGTPITPCERTGTYKHHKPTYTLGVDWQVDRDHLLYFVTRKGYRSGGINERSFLPSQFRPFQPEFVTDYEVGLKADWHFGLGLLRTNLAAFYQKYRGIQRTQTQVVGGSFIITNVVNAASAKVPGFEADLLWAPIRALEIRAYYALTDAKYQHWIVPLASGGTQDRSGFMFANTPKKSGGGSVTVRHELAAGGGELSAGVDLYAQSRTQISDDNVLPEGITNGYTMLNARLQWEHVLGHPVTVAAWIRNLTDTHYYTSGVSVAGAGLGFTVKTLGAPRTFGISARYDF